MIVGINRGLGGAVCDEYYTQLYGGVCADAEGWMLKPDGSRVSQSEFRGSPAAYMPAGSTGAGSAAAGFALDSRTIGIGLGFLAFVLLLKK